MVDETAGYGTEVGQGHNSAGEYELELVFLLLGSFMTADHILEAYLLSHILGNTYLLAYAVYEDEYAGAIMGQPVNDVDYRNNYYSNCTIGNNTDNIGSNSSDITTDDAAVKATILFETETAPSTLANGEKVVFRREFKQGLSSTVCLPVAIDETLAAAAGKFYTFAGVDMTDPDEWTVVMQEVAGNNLVDGDLQANTPYLFMPDADGPVLFIGEQRL